MIPKGMSDCAGMAEGEEIPYFDITDATHTTCHMIFLQAENDRPSVKRGRFRRPRPSMDVVVVVDAWSMARGGAENGTERRREINQIRVGDNLAAARRQHGDPEHCLGWRCIWIDYGTVKQSS